MKIIIIIPKCNWTRPVETVLLTEKNFLMKKTSILRCENRIVLFRQDDTLDNRISSCIRWRNTSSHIKWTGCECKKNETSTNVRELHSFVTLSARIAIRILKFFLLFVIEVLSVEHIEHGSGLELAS